MTSPTAPEEKEIAEERNIVVPCNGPSAGRAMRTGPENPFMAGDAVNSDVEKAAHDEAD